MDPFFPVLAERFSEMLAGLAGHKVAVVGHARPDGDCIGSQVALARVLKSLGHEVLCVNADVVPRRLQFLSRDTRFVPPLEVPADYTAVFVDCADHARVGEKGRSRFPSPFGGIDHHISNDGFASFNLIDVHAAATCEILAGVFLDNRLTIDAITAQALYTGIMTDTGQFRFNCTTRRTFMLAAELVQLGVSPAYVGAEVYERESAGKMRLLERYLASFTMECGGRVCVGMLPQGVFEETGTLPEDTEGLVDYARSIDGVDIGVLIEERPGAMKASLRAKDPLYRVDQVAALFGGGGHACAAGLNYKNSTLAEFRPRLLAALTEQIARVAKA